MRSRSKGWNWLVYSVVGLCLVIAVYLFSISFPGWKPTAVERNLSSVVLGTIVLFGYLLKWGWRYRRLGRFWLAFVALMFAHTAVLVPLSLYVEHWPVLGLGLIIGVEATAMAMIIFWAVDSREV